MGRGPHSDPMPAPDQCVCRVSRMCGEARAKSGFGGIVHAKGFDFVASNRAFPFEVPLESKIVQELSPNSMILKDCVNRGRRKHG